MTEPLAVVKTCPHVMSAADAERALPWDHEGPHTGAEQRDYGRAIAPSVKWLVVAKPLVCPTCEGSGLDLSPASIMQTFARRMNGAPAGSVGVSPCPDCKGTGLPGVRIVSHGPVGSGKWPTRERTTDHGVVSVDAAVPIVTYADYRGEWGLRWRGGPFIYVRDDRAFLYTNTASITDITDDLGEQDFSPGLLAYCIQPKETA